MNISGIRPSEGFYSYNSIRVNELRNSQIMSSKQAVDDTLHSNPLLMIRLIMRLQGQGRALPRLIMQRHMIPMRAMSLRVLTVISAHLMSQRLYPI